MPTEPDLFSLAGLWYRINSVIGDVRDSYKNPVYAYETNVMGTVNVLECTRLTPFVKSFVNVTTDKVYLVSA